MSLNNNSEHSQNLIPTFNTLSHPDDLLIEVSSDSSNEKPNEKSDKQVSFKRSKNAHPLWKYFVQSSDENYIDSEYLKSSTSRGVEHYGIRDEKKVKKINRLLVRWIVCNQQPFCVAEDEDFRMFVFELDPATGFLQDKQSRSTFG
ncbi:7339_t:CDS:2, partial [Racocetra fulgida]